MNDQFKHGLAKILSVPAARIELGTQLNESNWDSMTMISAIALIDETFGITVPVDKLGNCGNVGDLMTLVDSAISKRLEGPSGMERF